MKYIFLILFFISFLPNLLGQDKIYDVVDKQPEFKGGTGALMAFIGKTFKYPDSLARTNATYGAIYLKLIIEKDGTVSCESCKSGSNSICTEARKMIEKMPKWKPAEYKGSKVRCRYSLPIHIDLE